MLKRENGMGSIEGKERKAKVVKHEKKVKRKKDRSRVARYQGRDAGHQGRLLWEKRDRISSMEWSYGRQGA